ncbi:rRNA small subunit methyltransferase I [Candidatus Rhodobacter oscarellae]|uniref:Ribosomal RNA small subunit methyltransferase I n=1 Tax=Candidatus Rhodobacter oscarellae TaxID=1675527 RepID=A0A0J9E6J0_9RHOB|nr:16S rRNA (cytidine(1402)-2'-O)-methyltransferase [Candidatus Rhodobacter lobularis]KMW58291.1 rRNA small subunit methyltransferase I [Candidatus Rhodobacter lobularis]
MKLDAGLYFVATPIGTARDITLRGLDILASADVLAAEDTRTLRRLMQIHGVALEGRQIVAYHDHNGAKARPQILRALREGRSVAYASEAGTPLVADPGFQLAREAMAEGLPVTSAPGPSAVMAALTLSGLPTDRFLFAGFPPASKGARQSWLAEVLAVPATVVIFESAKRINRILGEMSDKAGEREAAVCRELTKRFEEARRGTVAELAKSLEGESLKGEIVLVIDRDRREAAADDMDDALDKALLEMSVKDAAGFVAEQLGLPKRQVYQAALQREKPE